MKSLITLIFITCSLVAFGQKVDTLKLPAPQDQAISDLEKQLKELEPAMVKIQSLQESRNKLIESALQWNNIRAEEAVYKKGVILYIRDEKKK